MFVATVLVSALLAAALTASALLKMSHKRDIVQQYAALGVPEDKLDYLAVLLLAGAGGLVIGLFWWPLGVAAAIGVILYFLGAVAFHVRARELKTAPAPVVLALVALAALILRLTTR
ncbi:DoxX family protein [Yinghuangia soli]|uniref:DoxX family protein n=1 Tax=Yinghuangia soli TaxID=2908204 RepID=A0AA41U1Z5_9ACTN|nr:DoxX family protein [Yinghuangia soli]MCF2528062.1 DoxX family protein [Yinghuangia soli]